MKTIYFFVILFAGILLFAFWQHLQLQNWQPQSDELQPTEFKGTAPIVPIPLHIELDPAVVSLGKRLFFEVQLSHDNTIACVSCHDLKRGGTDQLVSSVGIRGTIGSINSPTVFNCGFNFRQFWDGRAKTLEEQVDGPIHADIEMGSNWQEIIIKLKQSNDYPPLFASIYAEGITSINIRHAIATFERSLYTPNSRFDQFLRGNKDALTALEQSGYQRFKSYGCISCHQGVNLGSNMFQVFGAMDNYFVDRGDITKTDLGRYNVTNQEEDKYMFKVPTLRNIALTAPYFHDGSAATLDQAIKIMLKYQLGRVFEQHDIDALLAFLKTLTGEYNGVNL